MTPIFAKLAVTSVAFMFVLGFLFYGSMSPKWFERLMKTASGLAVLFCVLMIWSV